MLYLYMRQLPTCTPALNWTESAHAKHNGLTCLVSCVKTCTKKYQHERRDINATGFKIAMQFRVKTSIQIDDSDSTYLFERRRDSQLFSKLQNAEIIFEKTAAMNLPYHPKRLIAPRRENGTTFVCTCHGVTYTIHMCFAEERIPSEPRRLR